MKTTSLKCPSCNASLKVEDFNKIIVCPYCDSTVVVESVSAENTSATEGNRATREGGAAGKNRASVKDDNSNQKENAGAVENTIGGAADDEKNKYNYNSNAGGYAENKPAKKRRTWLWVLGWMCIFPIPLTILMLSSPKTKSIDLKARIIIVAVAWVVYLIIYSVYTYYAG